MPASTAPGRLPHWLAHLTGSMSDGIPLAATRRQSAITAISALVVGAVLALTLGSVASAQSSPPPAETAPADTTPPAQIPADVAAAVAARPTDVLVSFDPAAGVQAMRSASATYPDAAHREQGVQAAASSYAKAKDGRPPASRERRLDEAGLRPPPRAARPRHQLCGPPAPAPAIPTSRA